MLRFRIEFFILLLLISVIAGAQDGSSSSADEFAEFESSAPAASAPPASEEAAPTAPVEKVVPNKEASEAPAEEPVPAESAVTEKAPVEKKPVARRSRKTPLKPNADFPQPMYFDIFGQEGALPPLQFEWDLTRSKGSVLKVGNVILSESTFYLGLAPLGKLMAPYNQFAGSDSERSVLVIRWPEPLLKAGQLEMISRNGSVLWKYDITESEIEDWKVRTTAWNRSINLSPKAKRKPLILSTQFGLFDPVQKGAPFQNVKDWFRFCISQQVGDAMTRLCSGRYMARTTKGVLSLAKQVIGGNPVRVLVKNENAPLSGLIDLNPEMPLQFYADLATGISYEFVAVPPKVNIADMAETKNPKIYRVVGWDTFPTSRYRQIKLEQYGRITEMLGFEATIKDTRKFWQAALHADRPYFYFPGEGGGVFKQNFDMGLVPPAHARVYMQKNAPKGTYSDTIYLVGRKHESVNVSSEEWSAENDTQDANRFEWNFKAGIEGEINRSYLLIQADNRTYRSYFEIYRSYSHELSGRFTGVVSGNSTVILGEVAYNYWVETIFGWSNYWLSRQRWGFNGKYFKSLNPLPIDSAGNKGNLDVTVLDLKYRLNPGLWTRDETLGVIASYQDLKFEELKAPMAGVGVFWARSMPAVFDRFFNLLPLMNYPKWVDMEFIYYTTPLKANVNLISSYSLNFHGQVLWKKNIFGEAGFGMKRYAFQDVNPGVGKKAELNTFYGTVGLGIKF